MTAVIDVPLDLSTPREYAVGLRTVDVTLAEARRMPALAALVGGQLCV